MPPKRATKKTHEIVADRLRDRILSGDLKVGDRLPPEDELTEQFGTARTTLREALRVLESQGLLTIRRGRGGGPVVTHPSLESTAVGLAVSLQLRGTSMSDLDAARRMIEPQVAGELARRHDDDDIVALRAAVEAAEAAAKANDQAQFALAAANMHETLIERSGNITLTTISHLLHVLVGAYYSRGTQLSDQRSMGRAVRSYRRLVDLIEAGDAEAAISHWEALMAYTIAGHDPTELLRIPSDR